MRGEALENDLRSLVSFTHKAGAGGRKASTRVLKFARMPAGDAPAPVREALSVTESAPLLYVERLRMADGEPVILERRHLVAARCRGLGRREMAGSLYAWLEKAGVKVTGADQWIRAINLKPADAAVLNAKTGTAAIWVHAIGRAQAPLWVEDTLYRGDRYEFHNVLNDGAAPRPARASFLKGSDKS